MKPTHVFLLKADGVEIPTVELHADSCNPSDCQCDWKREQYKELASEDHIDAVINARCLAKKLNVSCLA